MKKYKGYIPLIDTGHCDLVMGEYKPLTSGKKWTFEGYPTIYEGSFNRMVGRLFMWKLAKEEIPYAYINPEQFDVSLNDRKKVINKYFKHDKDLYVVSIHGNAYKENQADGIRGFTSKGETGSDTICKHYLNHINLGSESFIEVDDFDRDKNFSILLCDPFAILLELGFMTSWKDYQVMMDLNRLDIITNCMLKAAKEIYLYGI